MSGLTLTSDEISDSLEAACDRCQGRDYPDILPENKCPCSRIYHLGKLGDFLLAELAEGGALYES